MPGTDNTPTIQVPLGAMKIIAKLTEAENAECAWYQLSCLSRKDFAREKREDITKKAGNQTTLPRIRVDLIELNELIVKPNENGALVRMDCVRATVQEGKTVLGERSADFCLPREPFTKLKLVANKEVYLQLVR